MRTALVALVLASSALLASKSAFAQDPPKAKKARAAEVQAPAAAAPQLPAPAPAAAPAPATTDSHDPGYGGAWENAPIAITPSCTLGDRGGIDQAEAKTAAEIVCYELAKRGANAPHEIRFGKLAGRTMVILSSGDHSDSRRTFITGMDEITVAAPRLVNALVDGKPLDDTRDVDNVLSSDSKQIKQVQGSMGFDGGLFGGTAVGAPTGASAGVGVGLLYRAGNLGIGGQGRLGGIGDKQNHLSSISLDAGARYYLSSADIAPFVGGGLGLSAFGAKNDHRNIDGSGCSAYATVGIELLRTHKVAISGAIRADVPFYALEGESYVASAAPATNGYSYGSSGTYEKHSQYVVPVSFNVNFLFR